MENGVKVLSEYRLERAREMLDAARQNLNINQYKLSNKRKPGRGSDYTASASRFSMDVSIFINFAQSCKIVYYE